MGICWLSCLFSALFTKNFSQQMFICQLIRFKYMQCHSFNWKFLTKVVTKWFLYQEQLLCWYQLRVGFIFCLMVTARSVWGSCIISAFTDVWYCHTVESLCSLEQTILIFDKSDNSLQILIDTNVGRYTQDNLFKTRFPSGNCLKLLFKFILLYRNVFKTESFSFLVW